MQIVRCRLSLHESLYYATREMGTLYETGNFLHNYALTYAFLNDSQVQVPYFCNIHRPSYADDLLRVNQQGIYVTPALPLTWDYLLVTWKIGQDSYRQNAEKFGSKELGSRNFPANIGRAKELAPESTFQCYVLSTQPLTLPRWIRLGKWHCKTLVEVEEIAVREREGEYRAAAPLNPLDVPANTLRAFDIVSMPPSSLVTNARCAGRYYEIGPGVGLPVGLQYTFPT